MVKNNISKKKHVTPHAFRGMRDALLVPRAGLLNNTVFQVGTDASGNSNNAWVFAPLGLTGVTISGSTVNNGTLGNLLAPCLRGLNFKSADFQWYRVTRAKVVFVSNVGSTVTGTITMAGYTDPADVAAITYVPFVSSGSTRTFDLAAGASKEHSVPIPVDSSWKKVSTMISAVGNAYPFNAAAANSFVVFNSVTDLAFGAFGYYVSGFSNGGSATSTNIGSFYIDYDIEFKSPIDPSINT